MIFTASKMLFKLSAAGFISLVLLSVGTLAQPAAHKTLIDFIADRRFRIGNEASDSTGSLPPIKAIAKFCPVDSSPVARRVIAEYGSVFAGEGVQFPESCLFPDAASVTSYQSGLKTRSAQLNGVTVELQELAMQALLRAVEECRLNNIEVIPFDGAIAGRRSFVDTIRLWNRRFYRALDHWSRVGKIDRETAFRVTNAPFADQVLAVMDWESKGYWFGTSLQGTIFASTAPPGMSQHLLLLAFDVQPPVSAELVEIFKQHGWYRTVRGDAAHFTYLGLAEAELPSRGLRKVNYRGVEYWIPVLPADLSTAGSD